MVSHRGPHRAVVAALAAVSLAAIAGCSTATAPATTTPATTTPTTTTPTTTTPTTTTPTTTTPTTTTPTTTTPTTRADSATPRATSPTPTQDRPARVVRRLPVGYPTGDARQVITVLATSSRATTARLQTWSRVGNGWHQVGRAVTANVGADGIGRASEQTSTTPAGSWTLTRAFGHDANPGTQLPYLRTDPTDWWISQEGRYYNTVQSCSASCPFRRGAPNEHLYDEMPYYTYAVVIDYNTANAPGGIRPGAGSAFFLHETVGQPTAGCVAIPRSRLVAVLRWLRRADHPRIVIGIS